MSAAARKAVGQRMRAYWAKRRARSGKKKVTTARKKAPAAVQAE